MREKVVERELRKNKFYTRLAEPHNVVKGFEELRDTDESRGQHIQFLVERGLSQKEALHFVEGLIVSLVKHNADKWKSENR